MVVDVESVIWLTYVSFAFDGLTYIARVVPAWPDVYVNPVGVPAVVTIAAPAVVTSVNVVVPFVTAITYVVGLEYPVMLPVPPNVPEITTVCATFS